MRPYTSSKERRSRVRSFSLPTSQHGTPYNLLRLLLTDLDLDEPECQESVQDSTKLVPTEESLEQIMNMLRLPLALEQLMTFGFLASLNSFLKLLVMLPLKLLIDIVLFIRVVRQQFTQRKGKPTRKQFKVNHSNIIFASLIYWAILFASVDTSKIYHRIRNQSSIKLYVMFGVLEISDKLLATVGQDLLNVVFATTMSTIKKPRNSLKFLLFYILSIGYLSLHTIVLIYQTISLTVAANSYSNSLVTLLLSNQFAEIKSSVFKRIDTEGLFQMSCSDIVERFQLVIMLVIIGLRNLVQINSSVENIGILPNSSFGSLNTLLGMLLGPTMIVIGSELLVDWIKHSYITKFNKMRPKLYEKYLSLLSNDVIANFKNMKLSSNTTYNDKLQQRLGLPLPALYVLFIVMSRTCFTWLLFEQESGKLVPLNVLLLGGTFVILIMFKLLLELSLLKWCNRIRRRQISSSSPSVSKTEDNYVPGLVTGGMGAMNRESRKVLYEDENTMPPDMVEQRKKKDSRSNLGNVMRYRMASKRIW